MVFGLTIGPSLPYLQLDVVLTPAELADPEKKKAALELLKAAQGKNFWSHWPVTGAAISILSVIGLLALPRNDERAR